MTQLDLSDIISPWINAYGIVMPQAYGPVHWLGNIFILVELEFGLNFMIASWHYMNTKAT